MYTLLIAVIVICAWAFGFFAGISSNEILIVKGFEEKKFKVLLGVEEAVKEWNALYRGEVIKSKQVEDKS